MEMETGRSMEWDTKHYITKPKVVRINLLRSCNDVVNVGVLVLHDYTFSIEECIVLSLGLHFIPPPRKRKLNLLSELIDLFTRRVRIK